MRNNNSFLLSVFNISSTGHMTQLSLMPADDILRMFVCLLFFIESVKQNKRIHRFDIFDEILLQAVFYIMYPYF